MKAVRILVCIGALLSAGSAQDWQQLGPNGATVSALATVGNYPDDVFLVTDGYPARILYTSNAGVTWTARDSIHDRVEAIASDPNHSLVLFCGGTSGKVRRTTDYGYTWTERGSLGSETRIRQLVVDPDDGDILWASAETGSGDSVILAVYRSTNAGVSWTGTELDTGYEAGAVLLAVDPDRPARVFCGGRVDNSVRLHVTTDAGATWNPIWAGLVGTCAFGLAVSPQDSSVLVCGTDAGIYRSTNSGQSWSLARAAPAWSVAFTPAPPHYGYAGSDNLVYRSNNDGLTWTAETTDFRGTGTRWLGLNPDLPLELYAGNGAGVFHTTNGGYAWTEITHNLQYVSVPFLYFHPVSAETIYTCPAGCEVIRSTDRGLTWSSPYRRFAGIGFTTGLSVNPRNPDTVGIVTGFDSDFHLSTDRGDSWVSYPVANRFVARGVLHHPHGPDTVYAWGGKRDSATGPTRLAVMKSTSAGQTWTTLLNRGPTGICLGFLFGSTGETLYAYGTENNSAALYRSVNAGNSWTRVNSGVSGELMRDFVPSPADSSCFLCATDAGVFRSLNNCASWTDLGLSDVSAVLPELDSVDYVLAGTDTQGLYFTTTHGVVWNRDTVGFRSRSVLLLRRHPSVPTGIYCASAGAGLKGKGVTGIAEQTGSVSCPGSFVRPSLVTNRVHVNLPYGSRRTTVDLYRTDGELARRIADLNPTPATLVWIRPPDLAQGVYLLVTRSGTERRVAKLVLTR